jgi:hypothetical protein
VYYEVLWQLGPDGGVHLTSKLNDYNF